jgi:hypothetical protein
MKNERQPTFSKLHLIDEVAAILRVSMHYPAERPPPRAKACGQRRCV